MKRKYLKERRGITLIALVITVIVLLILAGTAITLGLNGGDLFGHANTAAQRWNESVINEETVLSDAIGTLTSMIEERERERDLAELQQYFNNNYATFDLFNSSTRKFKNTEPIMDAETSIIAMGEKNLNGAMMMYCMNIQYKDNIYYIEYAHLLEGDTYWSHLFLDNYEPEYGLAGIYLGNRLNKTTFSNAYVIIDGKKVDISDKIETTDYSLIDVSSIEGLTVDEEYKFTIVKDEKEYSKIFTIRGER